MESPHTPDQPRDDQPGPQAPPPSPAAPPPPPPGPQAPQAPGPEGPPSYGGPVPPGGWQQPIPQAGPGWAGQPLASWGSRLAATLIDWLILLVPVVILTVVIVAIATGSDTGAWVSGVIGFLVYLVALLLYAPLLMARDGAGNGQTWGKQMMSIRVVRDTGQPMGFGWAALREIGVKGVLLGIASSIIPFIPWFLNYFWPLWDDQNRALHDMICSTHVVRT
jgi:uncharacterized RDD family membrane protein YckC